MSGIGHEPIEPIDPNWARLMQGPLANGEWFRGYGVIKDGVIIPDDPQPVTGPVPSGDPDKARGLYSKFSVTRVSREAEVRHYSCEYFVLDVTHDPHAAAALRAYADSCEKDYPTLAEDLRELSDSPVEPKP